MIAWSIEKTLESGLFSRVVVSTDDEMMVGILWHWSAEIFRQLRDRGIGVNVHYSDTHASLLPGAVRDGSGDVSGGRGGV